MIEKSLTPAESEYLKLIYTKQVEEGRKLRSSEIARFFNVHPATITDIFRKLTDKGLTRYKRYYGVELTEKGITEAQRLLRKQRILETLFVGHLKYDIQKSRIEASNIALYCSKELINSICQTYGHPKTCPCNKMILADNECCDI